jgi:hypothetical protein
MNTHQAVEQMLGYLYQVRYALFLLLDNDDEQTQISIEKFDDIAFSNDGDVPEVMLQLKHHTKTYGNLTDASTDIWRTIKVWVDLIKKDPSFLTSTKFLILTTAKAPEGTAANYLKPQSKAMGRDEKRAYNILENVAKTSTNAAHTKYYNEFMSLGDEVAKKLVSNIYIIDGSSNIVDVKDDILKVIRYGSLPKFEQRIFERLEGWWWDKCIEYLLSDKLVFISQKQIRSIIASIRDEYTEDNLPIDVPFLNKIEIESLPENKRIFYEQLQLICLSNNRIKVAISDYYRAFEQRANWVREDLLYINELDKYEERLLDEWQRLFFEMEEELDEYEDLIEEKQKQKYGRLLFNRMQDKDIRIRARCSEPFVMRGSYHILANKLLVGWHVDFDTRLRTLLT